MSNTLISKLGFADPDKHNPNHDLACIYLTEPHVQERIQQLLTPLRGKMSKYTFQHFCSWRKQITDPETIKKYEQAKSVPRMRFMSGKFEGTRSKKEHPITKGTQQYKTTIGFIDVWMMYTHRQQWKLKPPTGRSITIKSDVHMQVILEVKTVIKVGEILRQLKLYKEYKPKAHLVLVSTVPVTALQVSALKAEGVQVIQLGEDFEEWKQARQDVEPMDIWTL